MTIVTKGWRSALVALAVVGAALTISCSNSGTTTTTTPAASATTAASVTAAVGSKIAANIGKDDKANLTGAGATFPAPLYQAWFQDYNKVALGVKTNYQGVGSGGGIQQYTEKTVDFGHQVVAVLEVRLGPEVHSAARVLGGGPP